VSDLCEVVITAPDPEWLLEITRQLVTEGFAASVHNFAPVRSIYRWQGEIHERMEGRASLHTQKSRVPDIIERIKSQHPYDVPGISTRPIEDGNPDYLSWMRTETSNSSDDAP
jgi:periplasmic divalent cation tolerance protein